MKIEFHKYIKEIDEILFPKSVLEICSRKFIVKISFNPSFKLKNKSSISHLFFKYFSSSPNEKASKISLKNDAKCSIQIYSYPLTFNVCFLIKGARQGLTTFPADRTCWICAKNGPLRLSSLCSAKTSPN